MTYGPSIYRINRFRLNCIKLYENSSESTHVKIPHCCWNSHAKAQIVFLLFTYLRSNALFSRCHGFVCIICDCGVSRYTLAFCWWSAMRKYCKVLSCFAKYDERHCFSKRSNKMSYVSRYSFYFSQKVIESIA